jgi:isoquinoline 1-oxidoreductase alpha subunit
MSLLWYLRDELQLPGTKYGCGVALCGACTVHVGGTAARACGMTVADAEGQDVVTIEGLSPDGNHPVQKAWRELNVPQCGFCQSGQIMQAAALLAEDPRPSDETIFEAMYGNVCRCGCYERIVAAVRQAATGA